MWKELLIGVALISAGVGLLWKQPTNKPRPAARKFKSDARLTIVVSPAASAQLMGISPGRTAPKLHHVVASPGRAVKIKLTRRFFLDHIVSWDGKTSRTEKVSLKPDKTKPIVFYALKTKPSGVTVMLGEKPFGTTPTMVVTKRDQALSIKLVKKGYLPMTFSWKGQRDGQRTVALKKVGPSNMALPLAWSWDGAAKLTVKSATDALAKGFKINASDPRGNTMLHFAAFAMNYKLAQWLMKKGASINARNLEGQTPLHIAFARAVANTSRRQYWSNMRFLKLLAVEGALPNALDQRAHTPLASTLWLMAQQKAPVGWIQQRVLDWLIKRSASIDAVDTEGKTPLHYASYYGHLELAKFLVKQKAALNLKDKGDRTPLDYAVLRNHFTVAAWLKKQGSKRGQ